MADEIELNIVVLPNENVRNIAIDISRKLRESFQTDFVLDGKTRHPHLTVYQARFPQKNVDAIRSYLKTVAARMAPFEVALGKFTSHWGYMFWESEPSNEFLHLSKSVVYQLNPLREGLVLKHLQNFKGNMGETYEVQNYGSLLVGSSVSPHITVAHLSHEQDGRKATQDLRPRVAKFVSDRMYLGKLGDYGTVTEILEEYPFGSGSPYMLKPQNYF